MFHFPLKMALQHLEKPVCTPPPSLSSLHMLASKTVPMLAWLYKGLSRLRMMQCWPLPFSTPLSFRLEELSEHGQARAAQHWSPEGKRSGERKRPTFHPPGREQSVFNQANIGTVPRATLGRLLRDRAERMWALPSTTMPSWAETVLKLKLSFKQSMLWCSDLSMFRKFLTPLTTSALPSCRPVVLSAVLANPAACSFRQTMAWPGQ